MTLMLTKRSDKQTRQSVLVKYQIRPLMNNSFGMLFIISAKQSVLYIHFIKLMVQKFSSNMKHLVVNLRVW